MKTATISRDGRITLPDELRSIVGWRPGDEVAFHQLADGVKIERVDERGPPRSESELIEGLRAIPWESDLPTDELMRVTRGDDE